MNSQSAGLDSSGAAVNNDTIILRGDETLTNFTNLDTDSGTVVYNGTSQYSGLAGGDNYNNLTINNGLIGYWKMDEGTGTTVGDSSGYGNTGTATNMEEGDWTTTKATLQYTNNYALDFDGSDEYVTASDNTILDAADTTDITLSGWFNRDTATTDDTIIAKRDGITSGDVGYLVYLDDATDQVIFEISDGTDEYQLVSSTAYTSTGWHHFAIVWDQDTTANSEIFLDGLNDSATGTGDSTVIGDVSNAKDFRIAAESDAGNPFDGKLDDIKIYNHVLSEQEINTLAAGSNAPTGTGRQTLDANLNVDGDLLLNSGELNVSASNYAINVAGTWENNGSLFTPRAGTVTLDGTTGTEELQSGGQAFNDLTVNGSGGTWKLHDILDVDGTYTQSNGTIDVDTTSNYAIRANDYDQTGGTFTARNGTVTIDGNTNQTINTEDSLYNLQIEDPTEANLVGYWKFDEGQGTTAIDSSGNNNTGTLTNAPKWSTTVQSTTTYDNPYSLDFDGTDDYVDISTVSGMSNPMTTTMWLKADSNWGSNADGFHWDSGNWRDHRFYSTGGSPKLRFIDESNNYSTSNVQSPRSNGVWYQYTIVVTDSQVDWYIDGQLFDSITPVAGNFRDNQPQTIGGTGSAGQSIDGQIDDVRVYSTNLNSTQIGNIYNGKYANGDSSTSTFTLNTTLDVDNDIFLQSGILDVSATPYNITLANNWNNYAGTAGFTDQTGTVTLDGTTQAVNGDTTFYNFSKTVASADTLTIEATTTQTIANTLTLDGAASNLLTVASSTNNVSYWNVTSGDETASYLSVSYSNASSNDITCSNCTNGGNNDDGGSTPYWIFGFAGTFTQNDWRWYVDSDNENVTDVWGNPDLAENTSLAVVPAVNDPPKSA